MKKKIIAVIGLVLCAALSVGALLFMNSKDKSTTKKEKQKAADYSLFSFDYETINKVTVECPDGTFTAVSDGTEWTLESGEFALDQSNLRMMCSYMSMLTAKEDYGSASSLKLSDFGLDSPTRVSLTDGTNTYSINIGNASPTGEYYYVTVDGKDKVYAISASDGIVLDASRLTLKSTLIIPYDKNEISEMIVKKNGEVTCDLLYDPETTMWRLPDEYSGFTFDTTEVTTMLTTFTQLKAIRIVDENLADKSQYGFDEPYAEVTIKGLDGTECSFLVSKTPEDKENYFHILNESDDQAAVYYQSGLSIVDSVPFDYLVQKITIADMTEVTDFDLSFNGNEDKFTLDTASNMCTMNDTALDLTDADISNAFRNFFDSISIANMSGIDIEASPELSDPVLTAVFRLSDGTEKTYQLTEADDESCYIFIDGEYTGGLISSDKLSGAVSVTTLYEKLLERAGIK